MSWRGLFLFVLFASVAGCGGGGIGNPLDQVPDESPIPELEGDWTLTAEITESSCEGLERGDTDTAEIRLLNGSCLTGFTSDFSSNAECRVGGGVVALRDEFEGDEEGCHLKFEESTLLEFEEGSSTLNGSSEGRMNVSGDCAEEASEEPRKSCSYRATITGAKTWDPSGSETAPPFPTGQDLDGDGVDDDVDNCQKFNPDQADVDHDSQPDACESDSDGDGLHFHVDNCPYLANSDQLDSDQDGEGDACDPDFDEDGISDDQDNCYGAANVDQQDQDQNGIGDLCQDFDLDRILDISDNCPIDSNLDQQDRDQDGIGDACEADQDGDWTIDDEDNCPGFYNFGQDDRDQDGVGDACEADQDGDQILDDEDNCPSSDNFSQEDQDGDGQGDACDEDKDGDGFLNDVDNCPQTSNSNQEDRDHDGLGDPCDPLVCALISYSRILALPGGSAAKIRQCQRQCGKDRRCLINCLVPGCHL